MREASLQLPRKENKGFTSSASHPDLLRTDPGFSAEYQSGTRVLMTKNLQLKVSF
jgi:hypothetical protein